MNIRKFFLLVLFVSVCLVTTYCAQSTPKPTVTLSATRIPSHGWVHVTGTGFTPGKNATSHLRRPDGSEFPVLPIQTNDRGEFSHDIDTLLLSVGTHDLWVFDDSSKTSSNVVQFVVTTDQP